MECAKRIFANIVGAILGLILLLFIVVVPTTLIGISDDLGRIAFNAVWKGYLEGVTILILIHLLDHWGYNASSKLRQMFSPSRKAIIKIDRMYIEDAFLYGLLSPLVSIGIIFYYLLKVYARDTEF